MVRVVPEVQIDFANVQSKVQKYFTYVAGTKRIYEVLHRYACMHVGSFSRIPKILEEANKRDCHQRGVNNH